MIRLNKWLALITCNKIEADIKKGDVFLIMKSFFKNYLWTEALDSFLDCMLIGCAVFMFVSVWLEQFDLAKSFSILLLTILLLSKAVLKRIISLNDLERDIWLADSNLSTYSCVQMINCRYNSGKEYHVKNENEEVIKFSLKWDIYIYNPDGEIDRIETNRKGCVRVCGLPENSTYKLSPVVYLPISN